MTPTQVILWRNGMVMAFGADGEQVSDYQGPFSEIEGEHGRLSALDGARWFLGRWGTGTKPEMYELPKDFILDIGPAFHKYETAEG